MLLIALQDARCEPHSRASFWLGFAGSLDFVQSGRRQRLKVKPTRTTSAKSVDRPRHAHRTTLPCTQAVATLAVAVTAIDYTNFKNSAPDCAP